MDLNEQAYERLLGAISDVSERCYCAGWMNGAEFACWRAVLGMTDVEYGQDVILREDAAYMLALSERCGGWVEFDVNSPTLRRFVPIVEWRLKFAKLG